MKTTITLNEAEIKKAVHEYVEGNTHYLDDNNAKAVRLYRDGTTGAYIAELDVETETETEITP